MTSAIQTAVRLIAPNISHSDLVALADGFDQIVADNNRFIKQGNQAALQEIAAKYGVGALYYSTAMNAYAGEVTLKILQGAGQTLVDMLRIGETIENPSWEAAGRDGLRVISLIPGGAFAKAGNLVRLKIAQRVTGGVMGCGPTALAKASALSGQKLIAPFFNKLKPFVPHRHPWHPDLGKPGVYMWEIVQQAKQQGIKLMDVGLSKVANIYDVAKAVALKGEPLIFQVRGEAARLSHFMTGYMSPQGVRFMDQFGDVWKIVDGALVNTAPNALAKQHGFLKIAADSIDEISYAFRVQEAAVFKALPHFPEAASIVNFLNGPPPQVGPGDPLGAALYEPIYHVSPNTLRWVEMFVRTATHRPRPLYPWEQPAQPSTSPGLPEMPWAPNEPPPPPGIWPSG